VEKQGGLTDVTVMVNRRERVRAATVQEIKDVARQQLVADGPAAVSLRAIAREMGMTAPALYRYFPSFDHLVQALISDLFDEVCAAVEDARDLASLDDAGARLQALCRTFRAWAVGHPAEFGLLFGSPLAECREITAVEDAGGVRFSRLFVSLFAEAWRQGQFGLAETELSQGLRDQLSAYRERLGTTLPLGALAVMLGCWLRIYGLVSLEVFKHTRFAFADAELFFEEQLTQIMIELNLRPAR
jgi:AcrR family transcriptional regulator